MRGERLQRRLLGCKEWCDERTILMEMVDVRSHTAIAIPSQATLNVRLHRRFPKLCKRLERDRIGNEVDTDSSL
jgi:hypothetical protein